MTPALALAALLAGAVQAAPARRLEFVEDARIELLSMVQLLARADRTSSGFFLHGSDYERRASAHFGRFAAHPAVERFDALARGGFSHLDAYQWVLSLGAPPELAASEPLPEPLAAKLGGRQGAEELRLLFADFARVSRFEEFFARTAPDRAAMTGELRRQAERLDLEGAFRAYAGAEPPSTLRIVASAFAEPVLSVSVRAAGPGGGAVTVYGPERHQGRVGYRFDTRAGGVWAGWALELFASARPPRSRHDGSRALFEGLSGACAATWEECAARHAAFAVGARMLERAGDLENAREWPVKYARIGLPYLPPLIERLKEHEGAPEKGLAAFYPRLLDALAEVAASTRPAPSFSGGLDAVLGGAGPVVFVEPAAPGPVLRAALDRLAARFPGARRLRDGEAAPGAARGARLIAAGVAGSSPFLSERFAELRLPARLEDGRVVFAARPGEEGVTAYAGRPAFVTAALNPDDPARGALVAAAWDEEELARALDALKGGSDFALFAAGKPVKAGFYEKSRLPWRLK